MYTTQKSVFIPLIISLLILMLLSWCSWQLHQYSKEYKIFRTAFLEILNGKGNAISSDDRVALMNSIDQQLICASSVEVNLVERFKAANNYPQNVLRQAFNIMLNMQIQIFEISVSDSVFVGTLMVGGQKPIEVSLQFVKSGDKMMLARIENVCPIFQKLHCFEKYRATESIREIVIMSN